VEPRRSSDRARFVHESRGLELSAPSPWTASAAAGACLALATLFATATAIGLSGRVPPWGQSGLELGNPSLRVLLTSVGIVSSSVAIVLTAAYLKRSENLLRLRLRLIATVESEGPCRLVQEAPDLWGLELSLDPAEAPHPAHELLVETRGVLRHPWEPGPAHCRLFFRLDEADAARLGRIFHPDEVLRLRWADLPIHSGGPTLLGVQTSAREVQLQPATASARPVVRPRQIRSLEPPDSNEDFRRAA
jgi:hypothetical protein